MVQLTDGGSGKPATQDDLRRWLEQTTGGTVTAWQQIAGGNRCQSWAVDVEDGASNRSRLYLRYQPPRPPSAEPYTVWREAKFYQALKGSAVPAPGLIAVHPESQAIITELVRGRAEFRRISSEAEKANIAREFVAALATLHSIPLDGLDIPGLTATATIADCIRQEIAIWRAMYQETDRSDPLIDLALGWLTTNVPEDQGRPALVHGDAGQGNFLFENGHLTALLDWELAHPGDPMEDLAWFSMRSVMEPAPDFPGLIAEYGRKAGKKVDLDRVRYHRVFVSTRVVIIRHRNVTGQAGNSIVSRGLNRRLLVEALANATGVTLEVRPPLEAPPTENTAYYDGIIRDLQHEIADVAGAGGIANAAKNSAKVLKYLREVDRLGRPIETANLATLTEALGEPPASIAAGKQAVLDAIGSGKLSFAAALRCFAACEIRDAQLAALSSGGLAARHFPPLEPRGKTDA